MPAAFNREIFSGLPTVSFQIPGRVCFHWVVDCEKLTTVNSRKLKINIIPFYEWALS